jgi:hypothetical protein
MTMFPIVGRELRGMSRNRATYWTRTAVALVGGLMSVEATISSSAISPSRAGALAFNLVFGAAFVVSCAACFLAADAISAERRQGTLELLFLTTVKPLDVVLGKLGSVGFNGLCSLAAFLPVLMVPVLAGGVTGGEVFRKGLVLMNTLFLALVAGLCASAGHQDKSRALRQAFAGLAIVVIIPFWIYASASRSVPHYVGLLSPLSSLLAAGDLSYRASPGSFWISLGFGQAISWTLLIAAAIRLHRGLAGDGEDANAREARLRKETERAVGLASWEPVKDESTPVEWLVHRRYGVNGIIWGVGMLALAFSGWVLLVNSPAWITRTPGLLFAWPLGVAGGIIGGAVVAWVSSRFFVGVRRTGDLELLMTTPLGAETILSDQWRLLKRFFVWPVMILQAPILPQILALLTAQGPGAMADGRAEILILKLLNLANVGLGAAALCWVGMWFGLRARTQGTAIVWTVALAKGVPFLLNLVCLVLGIALLSASTPMGVAGTTGPLRAHLIISGLSEVGVLVYYFWLINRSQKALQSELKGTQANLLKHNSTALTLHLPRLFRTT